MTGLGTMINIVAVLVGATVGMLIGNRFSERTRETTTNGLGLITLVVGALNIGAIGDRAFADAVGADWTLIVVLGAVVLGGILGSLVRVEDRLNNIGGRLQTKFGGETGSDDRARFIEGYVSASLLFCVGPLTILGSLSDGLGTGSICVVYRKESMMRVSSGATTRAGSMSATRTSFSCSSRMPIPSKSTPPAAVMAAMSESGIKLPNTTPQMVSAP